MSSFLKSSVLLEMVRAHFYGKILLLFSDYRNIGLDVFQELEFGLYGQFLKCMSTKKTSKGGNI